MASFDRFPIRVRARDGEPAIAALGRTFLRMGLGSERELAAMFGLRLNDVARGRSNARLATLMGRDAGSFASWTPSDVGDGRMSLRGQVLRPPHDLAVGVGSPRRIRGCPECLRADLADPDGGPAVQRPYVRAWWYLRDVYTCPTHLCALVEVAVAGRIVPPDRSDGVRLTAYWGGLCEAETTSVPKADTLADAYVLGRLGAMRRAEIPFLDDAPLGEASAVLNWIGELVVSGTKASYVRKLPFERAAALRSRGLEACLDWPHGLNGVLRSLQERAPPTVRGLKGRFGRYYSRLYDDRGARGDQEIRAVLRDAMRTYIVEHVPLDLGETVFRDGVEAGRRITVGHAAKVMGISPKEMLARARAEGLLADGDTDGRLYGLLREDIDGRLRGEAVTA